MVNKYIPVGITSLSIISVIILYLLAPLGENFFVVGDSVVTLCSFFAFVAGIWAARAYGIRSAQGKALLLLSLGVFLWFMGELTWSVYEVVLGAEKPVASIADVFWLLGYAVFIVGFYYILKVGGISSRRKSAFLTVIAIIVATTLVYMSLPTLFDEGLSLEEKISTAGYIIGDMLLLVSLIVIIGYMWGSRFAKAWSIILFAFLLSTIADVYYTLFLATYETGNIIDILWNVDYILLAYGFYFNRMTLKSILDAGKKGPN